MADKIKGITIELGGDTKGFQKALKELNTETNKTQREMNEVNRLLKLDPNNTELLAQKQQLLAKATEDTKTKLQALKQAKETADKDMANGTEINQEQYRKLQREIAATEIKINSLENETKDLGSTSNKEISQMGNSFDDASKKTVSFGEVLKANVIGDAIVGGIKSLGNGVKDMATDVMESADELQALSDKTGLSAEKLQELQYVGDNVGVELDTMTGSFSKLIKNMSSASGGSGAAYEAFKKLGVSVTDSNGELRDSNEVWQEAITALGNVSNETEQTAIAQQIFGKSASELNPLIRANKDELATLTDEARKSGAIMSDETVAGVDAFGDTLDNVKKTVLGQFGSALSELTPELTKLAEEISKIDFSPIKNLVKWILDNKALVISSLAGIAAGFAAFEVVSIIQGVITAMEGMTLAQYALNLAMNLNPIGIVIALIAGLVVAFIVLWNKCEGFRNFFIGLGNTIKEIADGFVEVWTVTVPNAITTAFAWVVNKFKELWQGIKDIFSDVGDFFGSIWETIKEQFTSIGSSIGDAMGGAFKAVVNSVISFAENTINGFIRSINFALKMINKIPGVDIEPLKSLDIPKMNVGTRYLPSDMLIQAHQGEMIVPKSENPYANSGGQVMPQMGDITIPLYIDNEYKGTKTITSQQLASAGRLRTSF